MFARVNLPIHEHGRPHWHRTQVHFLFSHKFQVFLHKNFWATSISLFIIDTRFALFSSLQFWEIQIQYLIKEDIHLLNKLVTRDSNSPAISVLLDRHFTTDNIPVLDSSQDTMNVIFYLKFLFLVHYTNPSWFLFTHFVSGTLLRLTEIFETHRTKPS